VGRQPPVEYAFGASILASPNRGSTYLQSQSFGAGTGALSSISALSTIVSTDGSAAFAMVSGPTLFTSAGDQSPRDPLHWMGPTRSVVMRLDAPTTPAWELETTKMRRDFITTRAALNSATEGQR
jgi:hypothetical protein